MGRNLNYPCHPSLRLGLESRLGLGLSLGLWEGWVGGLPETWIGPTFLASSVKLCEEIRFKQLRVS